MPGAFMAGGPPPPAEAALDAAAGGLPAAWPPPFVPPPAIAVVKCARATSQRRSCPIRSQRPTARGAAADAHAQPPRPACLAPPTQSLPPPPSRRPPHGHPPELRTRASPPMLSQIRAEWLVTSSPTPPSSKAARVGARSEPTGRRGMEAPAPLGTRCCRRRACRRPLTRARWSTEAEGRGCPCPRTSRGLHTSGG